MKPDIDISKLAVKRDGADDIDLKSKRHVVTRYVIPIGLLAGFLGMLAWAARDWYLPRYDVTVMPVLASRSAVQQAGTPLFKAAGWIEPRPLPIRVSALSSGVVRELLVVEDQKVEADEAIAYLVDDDAKLALNKAKAVLELRKAELEKAMAELTAAATDLKYPVHLRAEAAQAQAAYAQIQTKIAQLPFAIAQAEANLKFAQSDWQSKNTAGEFVAGVDMDRAKANLVSAQAKVRELEERLKLLKSEKVALYNRHLALAEKLYRKTDEKKAYGETLAKVKAAKARLDEATVAVAEAQLRLSRMTIRAPVAGRVLRLMAAPGTHLAAGMGHTERSDPSTVVTMYQPDSLQVRVDVTYDNLRMVQRGQPVRIETPALAKPIIGTVLFVSSLADIQKNTLDVKVGLTSAPDLLKPEMLVDVTFLAPPSKEKSPSTVEQRLFVPKQLLLNEGNATYIWVADTVSSVARKVRIKTARASTGDRVEVTSGLRLTSRLIVGGRNALYDGARIRVVGEDTTIGVGP